MRLTKEQSRQRWRELRQILNEWDPIGVIDGEEGPWDEYQSYVGSVMRYLEQNAPEQTISDYLESVVTQMMGMSPNAARSTEYAARIVAWYRERWYGTSI